MSSMRRSNSWTSRLIVHATRGAGCGVLGRVLVICLVSSNFASFTARDFRASRTSAPSRSGKTATVRRSVENLATLGPNYQNCTVIQADGRAPFGAVPLLFRLEIGTGDAGQSGARHSAVDIFAVDDFGIFAFDDHRMRSDKARHLCYRAPVASFAALGHDKRLRFAKRYDRLEPVLADPLRCKEIDHGNGSGQAETLVVGFAADRVCVAVDAETDLGELTNPVGLLAQGVAGAAVEHRAVEGEVDSAHDLAGEPLRQIRCVLLFAVHDLRVVHGGVAKVSRVQQGSGLAMERTVDRVASGAGCKKGQSGQSAGNAKVFLNCHCLNPSHSHRSR